MNVSTSVPAVYGPVQSWRFGRSLGIDLISAVATCSFNCRYCQLGKIERLTGDRTLFVPTADIDRELMQQDWESVDAITFSGSGEPTLALNLGTVIQSLRDLIPKPIVVLTNGTRLGDAAVQAEMATADIVSVKLDAASPKLWNDINRPTPGLHLESVLEGIAAFRKIYSGHFAIQTMVMEPWPVAEEQHYVDILKVLQPDEVQLNTPLRPRPLTHQVTARGNHAAKPDATWRQSRHVSPDILIAMSDRLQANLTVPVRHPYQKTKVINEHTP